MVKYMPRGAEGGTFFPIRIGHWFLVGCFAAILLFAMQSAVGQSSQGLLSGTVTDPQGAVVRGAKVTVTATATNVVTSTETNDAGLYIFTALNPGDYTISVKQSGFGETVIKHVIISAAQKSTVAVQLKLGSSSASITVTAQDSLLIKEATDVSTTVEHQLVAELPYPERSAMEAALLVPGVQGDPLQPGGIATENPNAYMSYVTPGATISIGGGAPGTSSYYVDGSDITQASYGRAGINLSGRVVGETTAITTGLSAKYGRTPSGMIIQNSASGTKDYHGGITWRHNDPFFNAIQYGSTAKSNQHENYFGFYLGGPVRIPKLYNGKSKTFFYVGIEPARIQTQSQGRGTFFTPDELAGHLNNSLQLLDPTVLKTKGAAAALNAPRVGCTATTPNCPAIWIQTGQINGDGFPSGAYTSTQANWLGVTPANGYAGVNDLSNQLAKNPLARYVLSHMPTPSNPGPYIKFDRPDGLWANDGTNAYFWRGAQNTDNRYSVRIDHNFGEGDQLFGRYTDIPLINHRFFALPQDNPMTMTPSDAAYSKDIAIGYTHVFTPNLVSNMHVSYMRVVQNRMAAQSGMTQDWAASFGLLPAVWGAGFPTLGAFSYNGWNYSSQIGPSNSNATGINRDQNFIVGADFTWTKGKHLLQFGGDIRAIQSNQYDISGMMGGRYSFSQNQSNKSNLGGSPLASFILGNINNYVNTPVPVPGYYRWKYYATYFQDDWHIKPNLTLNLGLRYNLETPRMEANNNQGFIHLVPGTYAGAPATAAFCFVDGCGSTTKTLWPINYKGIEPRLGISWAPTSRTTVRASYGLLHLPLTGYENTPDPNLNMGSYVDYTHGGTNPNSVTNYITNNISPNLTSIWTAMGGQRGPFYYINGLSPVYVNQSDKVPFTQTWSLTTQYQLNSTTMFQASYQGMKGANLIGPFTAGLNTPSFDVMKQAIASGVVTVNGVNYYPGNGSIINAYGLKENGMQALSPYGNWYATGLNEIYPRNGRSSYNALYMSVTHRFNKGLSALANYTWQKSLDDVSQTNGGNGGGFGYTSQQNPWDLSSEYSVSNFDQAARLKYGLTYSLPFGKGRYFADAGSIVNKIMDNFTIAAIGTNSDGIPLSVSLGTVGNWYAITPSGVGGCNPGAGKNYCVSQVMPTAGGYGLSMRPDIIPGVPLINPDWKKNPFNPLAPGGVTPYLNEAAFAVPGSGGNLQAGQAVIPGLGNAPRTLANARSPREMMCDLRISKAIGFDDNRYKLNFNATLNNAFNHPVYFGAGNLTLDTVTTDLVKGQIIHTPRASWATLNQGQTGGMSRVMRFGVELNF